MNLILNTDSYKASHFDQYPPEAQGTYFYLEARKPDRDVVFFGLQPILKQLSQRVTHTMINEAKYVFTKHGLPFNERGWRRIADYHGGRLPVVIKAVPEGMIIPSGNVLMTVQNLAPDMPWLPSYIETQLLRVWYPTTVASLSYEIKRSIRNNMESTGSDMAKLPFMLHDFGSRGVSSTESSAIGGAAHLTMFLGTDNVPALVLARDEYDEDMAGFSIPAMEHSTVTSWGQKREIIAYNNMLTQYGGPGKIIACVSDSYNLDHAVDILWGDFLRERVKSTNTTIVIRPDSGDPVETVLRVLNKLGYKFGYKFNPKGYKILNNIRVIQGDGVDKESIAKISIEMVMQGWSMDNIAFGMGGALLQRLDRDTLGFAYKCSAVYDGQKWIPVKKNPINAPEKTSKEGILELLHEDGKFRTVDRMKEETMWRDKGMGPVLRTVFINGAVMEKYNLKEVRNNTGEW